jgi:hypothetical protein
MRIILWALIILSPLVALAQNYHWSLSNAQRFCKRGSRVWP